MLKSVKLTNFRKHRDRFLEFSPGLNVIRGVNEIGKTTVSESICYLFFGARALRQPVAEVVTYDEPENSLRVDLHAEISGVELTAYRSPRGAEVHYGDRTIVGQTETKKFFESLFNCSAELMSTLQIAGQNSVRGVLASDSKVSAGGLVEVLANLQVIEQLINKVQEHWPSGNTKIQQSHVTRLKDSEIAVPDMPDPTAVEAAKNAANATKTAMESARKQLAELPVKEATATIREAESVKALNKQVANLRAAAQRKLDEASAVPLPITSQWQITDWEFEIANEQAAAIRRRAFEAARAIPTFEGQRTNRAEVLKSLEDAQHELKTLGADRMNAQMKYTQALAKIIKDKSCAFCQKDLSEVPEVLLHNAKQNEDVQRFQMQVQNCDDSIAAITSQGNAWTPIFDLDRQIQKLNVEYWDIDTAVLPATFAWKGAPPSPAVPLDKLRLAVADAKASWAAYEGAQAALKAASDQLASLAMKPEVDTSAAEEVLAQAKAAELVVADWQRQYHAAEREAIQVQSKYDMEVERRNTALKAAAEREAEIASLSKVVEEMEANNGLIKALREARPQITAQLWGTVLGAISHYFTSIRGEVGMVTRDTDAFKVNGRSIHGLSGSTLDALGLAIRIALSKVFLPSVPFVFLDEVFAGADDNRETNGFATIAASSFEQVLLVTHSDLGDSLADRLIVL